MKRTSFLILMFFFAACSTASHFQYPPVRWLKDTDRTPIKEPKAKGHEHAAQYDRYTQQAEEALKFAESMAALPRDFDLGGRTALNTNNFDEVADSTWFTNRIGRTGSFKNDFTTPPDLKNKVETLSTDKKDDPAEYVIRDSKGDDYLIKFDDSADGIESSSEVLGAIFLHNIGYNVTENYIVEFNGKRALAIRMPKGDNLGHFLFNGKRRDDPNDRIPHEYRRELRGLRLFAAFLNNKEIGINNNLDIYDSYVTHYLTNYTTPLASMRSEFTGGAPKREQSTVDALFSFGMYNPYWTSSDKPAGQKGGIISSKDFDPDKWQPRNNNTAFKFMTRADAFWAAKILAKFTDDDIHALVSAAGYLDKKTSGTVAGELMIRRDKIVGYYFSMLPPLDDFALQAAEGGPSVTFADLAPLARISHKVSSTTAAEKPMTTASRSKKVLDVATATPPRFFLRAPCIHGLLRRLATTPCEKCGLDGTRYRWRLTSDKGTAELLGWQETMDTSIAIPPDTAEKLCPDRYYVVQLQLLRPNARFWSPSVDIYLKKSPELTLVGIKRRYAH